MITRAHRYSGDSAVYVVLTYGIFHLIISQGSESRKMRVGIANLRPDIQRSHLICVLKVSRNLMSKGATVSTSGGPSLSCYFFFKEIDLRKHCEESA